MAKEIGNADDTNIRKTPQCTAVLKSLKNNYGHPTASDIHNDVIEEFPNISLATVYNNLKKLTKNNIIQEVYVKNGPSRFDKNPSVHYHMICNNCGEMKDLSYPILNEIEYFARGLHNFVTSSHEFNLYGICDKCQSKIDY